MKFVASAIACFALSMGFGTAYAGSHDPADIIPLMAASKLSLIDGIRLAEAAYGPATSAKFEVGDDGKLSLSVYNIPEGLDVEPEAATLSEVSLDPTVDGPALNFEVFSDKEHLARAASHLTLARLSRLNLIEVLERATFATGATPIDVRNPTVVNHHAVAEVVLFEDDGDAISVVVDLQSGRIRRSR